MNPYRFTINKNWLTATKGKIIFGFLMAIVALLAAWGVSRFVFTEMILTVDKVSKPDEKLSLVNQIFNRVYLLDQKQRYQATNNQQNSFFAKETREIRLSLDTLKNLYRNDSLQLGRINYLKKLLADRDKQFILYLKVRDSLVNTKTFSNEVKKLNELFAKRAFQSDSAVYTTESKTSTTTLEGEKNKGIFNKIFGKKKAESYKIVSEELKIKRDTLDEFLEDSILKDMESSLSEIEQQQKLKSNKFIEKERNLASTSDKLTSQMLGILDEVRNEALAQINVNGQKARTVVNAGVKQITLILLAFFVLTIILIYLILSDIGKSNQYRLALEEAKLQADENALAKQRFLSNMSHEIRTPLQSIIGYAERLNQNENTSSKPAKAIYQSAMHLLQVINEVLDYSRITSGKFSLQMQNFKLKTVLEDVLTSLEPLALQKNLQLKSQLKIEENILLKGDAFRLKQILLNVLGNAIKFTKEGWVSLAANTKIEGNSVRLFIEVQDTGIGISEEKLKVIFEEFEHHLDETEINKKDSSTGLGLSIVKHLVDMQNGQIQVESSKGKGTRFFIGLSYPFTNVASDKSKEKEPIKNLDTGANVWLIDDDELILDVCAGILDQHQISYTTFNHPTKVLNYQTDDKPSHILMDMRMPEINGLQLIHLLKKTLPPPIKYYAVTAQALENEKQEILSNGFDGIIIKPFTGEELLKVFNKSEVQTESAQYDLSNLKKMTFGDTQQIKKIMIGFAEDCMNDINALRAEILNNNIDNTLLITHRLAGRTGQIGYKDLAFSLRNIEKQLEASNQLTQHLVSEVEINLQKLSSFIKFIKNSNYSI